MIHRSILILLVMASLTTGLGGCTRVYQTTMDEMARPDHERLASRIEQLRRNSVRSREAVVQSAAQLHIARTAIGHEQFCAELHALDLSMQRLELHVWNLRRSTASVRDVGEGRMAFRDDQPPLPADRYRTLLINLDIAHDAAQQMIEATAYHRMLLSADFSGGHASDGGTSRSQAPDPDEAATAALARIDAAIRSADALLAALPKE